MSLKFSATYYPVRMIFHISNIDTLQMIYLAYFLSVIKYGKIFWRNSVDRGRAFILQERKFRIMAGVGSRVPCRRIYKKLDILSVSYQYFR